MISDPIMLIFGLKHEWKEKWIMTEVKRINIRQEPNKNRRLSLRKFDRYVCVCVFENSYWTVCVCNVRDAWMGVNERYWYFPRRLRLFSSNQSSRWPFSTAVDYVRWGCTNKLFIDEIHRRRVEFDWVSINCKLVLVLPPKFINLKPTNIEQFSHLSTQTIEKWVVATFHHLGLAESTTHSKIGDQFKPGFNQIAYLIVFDLGFSSVQAMVQQEQEEQSA